MAAKSKFLNLMYLGLWLFFGVAVGGVPDQSYHRRMRYFSARGTTLSANRPS